MERRPVPAREEWLARDPMSAWLIVLLPLFSALCITLSLPPVGLAILGWFGLSSLFVGLGRSVRPFTAGLQGFLFGCLFTIGSFGWAAAIPSMGISSFVILMFLFCLYFAAFGMLYRFLNQRLGGLMIVGAPALWILVEYARSNAGFLSMPWNLLGHSQYRSLSFIQIADLTGVYGVSFLVATVNQFLAQTADILISRSGGARPERGETTQATPRNPWGLKRFSQSGFAASALIVAVLLVAAWAYGDWRQGSSKGGGRVRVALVQGNSITRDRMSPPEQDEHLRAYETLTREAAKLFPQVIFWPASSLPAPITTSRLVRWRVARLAQEVGVPILVGSAGHEKLGPVRDSNMPHSNSEFLVAPSGQLAGVYHKILLLPFNEYLPLQGCIRWPHWITDLERSFIPGDSYTLFEVAGARFGTPVCWENMFPWFFGRFVRDGAQFMVSVTNEAVFGRTAAPYQMLAMVVMRAVENQVAVARVATTGISALIDSNGVIIDQVRDGNGNDLFVSGVLVGEVSLNNRRTFYTLHGDVFAISAMGLLGLLAVGSTVGRRPKRSRE
jgi:apolipoprotein N-acyltransferase